MRVAGRSYLSFRILGSAFLVFHSLIEWHTELLIKSFPALLVFVENFACERCHRPCEFTRHADHAIPVCDDDVTRSDDHTTDRYRFVYRLKLVSTRTYAAELLDRKRT